LKLRSAPVKLGTSTISYERAGMDYTEVAKIKVSRFIIGGNPFSAISHQSLRMDEEMKHYFTVGKIKETLFEAERLGVNTFVGRTDHHIIRLLVEYWDQGGSIQWFAQTAPELGAPEVAVKEAASGGAKACHIHGGVMDYLLAQNRLDEVKDTVKMIHDAGLAAAVAGHKPAVFEWAEENLDVDYYLCSYYCPTPRDKHPEHIPGLEEHFDDADRQAMVEVIGRLSKPVVHYKIMACGRNDPVDAFAFAAEHMRDIDAVCVGICQKDKPDMLAEDVHLLEKSLDDRKKSDFTV